MTEADNRRQLRAVLKWALRPSSRPFQGHDGKIKEWFEHKLDGCAAYGAADKSGLNERSVQAVKLHYEKGWSIEIIAANQGISVRQVVNEINKVLDFILDSTDPMLLAALTPQVFSWRIHGCPHCGGDQFWDAEQTAYGCTQCARYFDLEGKPIVQQRGK